MQDNGYTLTRFLTDLEQILSGTLDEPVILSRIAPLAKRVALGRRWLETCHYEADPTQGFGSHILHQAGPRSPFVTAVSWLPGRGAPPHNHGSWAVVVGVDGVEKNTFWRRLDDGTRGGYAAMEKAGERICGEGDVLPMSSDTIHSVHNESERTTLSFHVYGRSLTTARRSQFDPQNRTESPFVVKFEPFDPAVVKDRPDK